MKTLNSLGFKETNASRNINSLGMRVLELLLMPGKSNAKTCTMESHTPYIFRHLVPSFTPIQVFLLLKQDVLQRDLSRTLGFVISLT